MMLSRIWKRLFGTSKERSPDWKDLQRVNSGTTSMNGEWSLTPEELATIFAIKGWTFASEAVGYGVPTADGLARMINGLVNAVATDARGGSYATLGRFLVVRDDDMPN